MVGSRRNRTYAQFVALLPIERGDGRVFRRNRMTAGVARECAAALWRPRARHCPNRPVAGVTAGPAVLPMQPIFLNMQA
jgi:hypothetical protein